MYFWQIEDHLINISANKTKISNGSVVSDKNYFKLFVLIGIPVELKRISKQVYK